MYKWSLVLISHQNSFYVDHVQLWQLQILIFLYKKCAETVETSVAPGVIYDINTWGVCLFLLGI